MLAASPTLATNDFTDDFECHLEAVDGRKQIVRIVPRLACEDMTAVRTVADRWPRRRDLVRSRILDALRAGKLARVLLECRGLPPPVRELIYRLAAGFPRGNTGNTDRSSA